jgi:hypothetical protein
MKDQEREKNSNYRRGDLADKAETKRLVERFSSDEEYRHRRRLLFGDLGEELPDPT